MLVVVTMTVLAACGVAGAESTADDIARDADHHRGIGRPHAFLARIVPESPAGGSADANGAAAVETVVEVRSNGFTQQLVSVLAPHRGDVMLATPDVVWLRPRRLHRLTRIPPELRMFNGASVADVTSIDVVGTYQAQLESTDEGVDAYVLALTARTSVRYPRARYVVRRRDRLPLRIDFMTQSGKLLKTVEYDRFEEIAGRTIPTKLTVHDHVYRDGSVILLSEFHLVELPPAGMFTPDYLLTLPDDA